MEWMGLNELREKYLAFFESKGHLRHKSYPLVPIGDKSILLINAGMTPLKKYFTGEDEPPRHRMTTCQKCIRTPDIERVGITARHGTYFEMLGNFSFGDYFKKEAIPWAWEFCTEVLKLPEERIWITIYQDDDEAFDIWNKEIGVPAERIVRLGKEDNFWEHGSGPCGPCSELHFDRGPEYGCGDPDCKPGCDCDRFMEFWNLVFTQFDNDGNGNYTRLSKPNIDTGMGLERLACLMQGVNNLFEVDTVRNIMKAISDKAGVEYGSDAKNDISLRVITDHIRSTTFLVGDGVLPSNEGRGYVLRRLLRRAARHGRLLGIKGTFLSEIVPVVAKENITEYPELTEKLAYIVKVVANEEERFAATIDAGSEILEGMLAECGDGGVLSGENVFRLQDTYGFPIDLTREIASERGIGLDEEGFVVLMNEQKQRAREARKALGDLGWASDGAAIAEGAAKTEFVGYDCDTAKSKVIMLIDPNAGEAAGSVSGGDAVVILDRTPFYGEGGGQVGDTGVITGEGFTLRVRDTKKSDGVYLHICTVEEGEVKTGDEVTASVDSERRDAIRRNHSAAHLLQSALRAVLGDHVAQAGSYVDDRRVRFDFSHFSAMTAEELAAAEAYVNKSILTGLEVTTLETDPESAKAAGATALFGEKYGDKVRMVSMGDISVELCGGTHIDNTAKLGLFKIISESSVAAGVRRIEGTTGLGVLTLLSESEALVAEAARELKVNNPADIAKRAAALAEELKAAKRENESLSSKLAAGRAAELLASAKQVGAYKLITAKLDGETVEGARSLCDELKASDSDVVAVLAVCSGDTPQLVCGCGSSAVKAGAHAGNIVKKLAPVLGARGGGRPDNATAGGGSPALIPAALEAAAEAL